MHSCHFLAIGQALECHRLPFYGAKIVKDCTLMVHCTLTGVTCVYDNHGNIVPPTALEGEIDQGLAGIDR